MAAFFCVAYLICRVVMLIRTYLVILFYLPQSKYRNQNTYQVQYFNRFHHSRLEVFPQEIPQQQHLMLFQLQEEFPRLVEKVVPWLGELWAYP